MSTLTLRRRSRPKRGSSTAYGHGRAAAILLGPWAIGLVGVTLGPMLVALYLSFTNYNFLSTPDWVGFQNYIDMFHDSRWWASLWVTLRYVVIAVPVQLAFALLLAILLDTGIRGLRVYRALFYLPSLLGTSVAVAFLWRVVFGGDGLLNVALGWIGIEGASWISDPRFSLATLILLHVWAFGSPMVIFLAGLRQIPASYFEAAVLDGAGKVRQFRSIILPLISPMIFFNLILQTVTAFQAFAPAYVVSRGTGGPIDSTLFYTLYLYQQGFSNYRMGYASAMAWVLVVIVGLVTSLVFYTSRRWVFYMEES